MVVLDGAVLREGVHVQPINLDRHLRRTHPVHRHEGLVCRRRKADFRAVQLDADDQLPRRLQRVAGGHGVEDRAIEHLGPRVRLHVDHRCCPRHGHRLLEPADPQHGIDGHREGRGELQLLADDGGESGERKGQGVGAGPQVEDRVASGAVGERGAGALDQHRAGSLDGDTGQHSADVVGHRPGKRSAGLGSGHDRQKPQRGQARQAQDGRTSSPDQFSTSRTQPGARSRLEANCAATLVSVSGLHESQTYYPNHSMKFTLQCRPQ